MSMQPWIMLQAPKVEWQLPKDQDGWLAFDHMNTRVTDVDSQGCARGFTLWSTDLVGNPVFMAFDWVELRPGVPILTDPNAVLTNLCILDDAQQQESKLRQVAHVNVLVYKTRWQEAAVEAVAAYREAADAAKAKRLQAAAQWAGPAGTRLADMRRAA